jgi:hypothetical protein
MAVVSSCATPIKGTHLRIVKLDACGNPVTGTDSMVVVTKSFVQVQMEPQYEDGEEFFERTADGSVCVNELDDPTLKRFQLTIDFCEVNVSAASWILSARELTTGTPTTGHGFAVAEGTPTNRFSLEVWQRVGGSGACDASGSQRYIYHAWPNVGAAQIGSYTIENGRSTLQVIGQTRGASAATTIGWLDGPGTGTSWLPAGITAESDEHWLWTITTTPPPTEACNPTVLT